MTQVITGLEYLGSFSVDSGQAIVGDPCYLDQWENWDNNESFDNHKDKAGQYGYLGACGVNLDKGYGTLGTADAVTFNTGYGDGLYPVYGKFNEDGRLVMAIIDFNGELEDEDQD